AKKSSTEEASSRANRPTRPARRSKRKGSRVKAGPEANTTTRYRSTTWPATRSRSTTDPPETEDGPWLAAARLRLARPSRERGRSPAHRRHPERAFLLYITCIIERWV